MIPCLSIWSPFQDNMYLYLDIHPGIHVRVALQEEGGKLR